jgi:uncharacterized lipoprotein YmbA
MKYALVLVAALALAGCGATAQEQDESIKRVESQLPADCTLAFVGSVSVAGYHHESHIFAVRCGDTTTTSINTVVQEGKTSRNQADVVITQN